MPSKLPEAVRRQGEAADAALRELNKPKEDDSDSYVNPGEPTGNTGIDPNKAEAPEQAGEEDEPIPQKGEDEEGKKREEDFVDWKAEAAAMKAERDKAVRAYESLKGKYNAELPALQAENRNLREQLDRANTSQQQGNTEIPATADLGEDEAELREMYGDQMVNTLRKIKADAVAAAKAELEPRLKQLDEFERENLQRSMQGVYDAIAKEHSDWEQVNELATFHKFLAEVDPNTGETRQTAIDRAQRRLDPNPIIRQISAFKRRSKRGNAALEGQVVPGNEGRTEEQPQVDEKIYSLAEIRKFQTNLALKVSRGKPMSDEEQRLNVKYEKALMEGRAR